MRTIEQISQDIRLVPDAGLPVILQEATALLLGRCGSYGFECSAADAFLAALVARPGEALEGCTLEILRLLSVVGCRLLRIPESAFQVLKRTHIPDPVIRTLVEDEPVREPSGGFDSLIEVLVLLCRIRSARGLPVEGSCLEEGLIRRSEIAADALNNRRPVRRKQVMAGALNLATPAYLPNLFVALINASDRGDYLNLKSNTTALYLEHPDSVEPDRFQWFIDRGGESVRRGLLKNPHISEEQARYILELSEPRESMHRGQAFARFPWFVLEAIDEHRVSDLCGVLRETENEEVRLAIAEILLLSARQRGMEYPITEVAPRIYKALGEAAGARLLDLFKIHQMSSSSYAVNLAAAWSGRPGVMLDAILGHGSGEIRGRPLNRNIKDEEIPLYRERILPALVNDRNKAVRERVVQLSNELDHREARLAGARALDHAAAA